MKKTFELDNNVNEDVNKISKIEKVNITRVLNVLLDFATYCYIMMKTNNLDTGQSKEIFKRGVECYVDNQRGNNI